MITGSFNTKKSCVSWKMYEMKFKFSKWIKSIVFRCLRANKTVGCSEYNIRNGISTQRGTGREMVKVSVKNQKKNPDFLDST